MLPVLPDLNVKDTCGADTETMTRLQRVFSRPFRLKNFIFGALSIFFADTLKCVWKDTCPQNLLEKNIWKITYQKEDKTSGIVFYNV